MKRRSSGSADDGVESSSLEPDSPDAERTSPRSKHSSRSASVRDPRPGSLRWKQANRRNGYTSAQSAQPITSPSTLSEKPSLSAPTPDMASPEPSQPAGSGSRRASLWSISRLALLTAALGIALLLIILKALVTRQLDPKGCRMSYMRPSYHCLSEFDTEHTRFATKYSLYLYREQGIDDENKLHGIPVLFIPGNAGSYKQVRPIAAEAANYFHDFLAQDDAAIDAGVRNLDFFTVDFNEDITAFHGQTLLDQAEYLNEAVRYILSLYADPQRATRDNQLPDPSSVIILGHSMGGIVARAMLVQPNYQTNSINTIITMSAPHARPPVTFDGQIVQIYEEINAYWRRAYTQKWANNNPLWHVTLVSIAGGSLDTVVPSDYASLESLVPETHGFTAFTTGIATVWTSMDHQAILWCDQFRKVVARALYDIVDVHRPSQTKPRADRMRVFKKSFLSGMEPTCEKTLPFKEATTLLTLDDDSTGIVPAGGRLVLEHLGMQPKPKAHLLPIPPHASPESKRFTLLTDSRLDEAGETGQLEVLLCSVAPFQSGSGNPLLPLRMDLSNPSSSSTWLACKNAASDAILLPASTTSTRYPFYLDGEREILPFSYLQYELDHLSDHQFVVVVDKAATETSNFVLAEFSDHSESLVSRHTSLTELLLFGFSARLPASRPTVTEIGLPSLNSALLAYNLELSEGPCNQKEHLFSPLVRQYINRPYESRYFVNASHATVSLHGVAPYMPPPLEGSNDGLTLQFWTDSSCESPLDITLKIDILASLGKLYMRYRTVFAAFPLLIATLVLRKQFRIYDVTGIFISFSESLDLSLHQSIPLLLLSLTLLSLSIGAGLESSLLWSKKHGNVSSVINFNRNDLLIGTEDPFFWFLVPLIGTICVGVCAVLHYTMLGLTSAFAVLYGLIRTAPSEDAGDNQHPTPSPTSPSAAAFVQSTPRRRMITTAVLLFLVSTFIPYQFAYLVACLVQLFTTVRALRVHNINPSTASSNYYHYVYSILLLMLWVLPINLPILAVWVRNLAVHWLTPFSSHHNVLSIMPFLLLVENLTTGRMVPQVTSWLRHVTSLLLFGTALCAAIYGVSHAYMLHYLVNVVAAWLIMIHSTSGSWSLTGVKAMFEGSTSESQKGERSL